MTIRTKNNNLLNYFIHDNRFLSKEYIKGCEDFLKNEIKNNQPKTKDHNINKYKGDLKTLNYITRSVKR